MGFLARAIESLTGAPPPTSDYWYGPKGGPTAAGVRVDEQSALTYSAVWCATRILSEGVAGLPALLYKRLPGGGKERAVDELLYGILHDEPNDETDSFQFFDQMTGWLVNWGNARAEIQRNGSGLAVALWPIHPTRVRVKPRKGGEPIVYLVKNDDHTETPIDAADMLDVCGPLSDDGITGKGVIRQAREAIGMGMATEKYGGSFFGNGAMPGGVLTHPGRLKDEARKNMRRSWNEMYSGPANANKIAILEEGVKYDKISVPPEEAQFLQTRQFNVTEIARWYRIPPHMLADLSRATFSNIEEQGIDFVVHSLRPWLIRWEKAITRKLIPAEQKRTYFVEFLVDALTRGDIAKRTAALQIQFMNGAINQDEWREIENRNPLPDNLGQQFYRPQNLAPVDAPADADPLLADNPMAPPAEPAPVDPATEPVLDQQDAATKGDVQATALNGAQIASLVQVSQMVVDGTFTRPAGRAIIDASFPLLSDAEIDAIVDNLEKKEPTPNADPNQAPPQAGTKDPAAPGEPTKAPPAQGAGDPKPEGGNGLAWFNDAVIRMRRKEGNAALRAAKRPREFGKWIDEFYAKHEALVAEVFAPIGATAKALAAEHCEQSRDQLLKASECIAKHLEVSVAKCVNQWLLGGPGSGPQGGPSPPPAKSAHHAAAHAKVVSTLRNASHLSTEQKKEYYRAATTVINNMPDKAVERMNAHTKATSFYSSPENLTASVAKTTDKIPAGKVANGAYDRRDGTLHLDGGSTNGTQSKEEIYAHEFGHAIDGPDNEISSSAAWHDAWKSESKHVSAYATTKPSEGLAEFAKAAHSGVYHRDKVAKAFPKSVAVFKAHGIW